jgi:tRNA-splicing ligase RtcB
VHGASPEVCASLGIPVHWAQRCEDAAHTGHDGSAEALARRLDVHAGAGRYERLSAKFGQLGSYGGGNHFGECEIVEASDAAGAATLGLRDGHVAFLSHCGSRGFGHDLAKLQFRALNEALARRGEEPPAGDRELVYAELGTPEANDYLDDMALGANFATLNHLLINALVLEAFQEVLPGVRGELVYFISHNIARKEPWKGGEAWVHRKGATRAFPAGHPSLRGTPFETMGHPILLPDNPRDGSAVMVAELGADVSAFSVNHGAGRALGRKAANRSLDQARVDAELADHDILYNTRRYPLDEAPDAYKDFSEVLASVEQAGLARTIARLKARFVIKDGAPADD